MVQWIYLGIVAFLVAFVFWWWVPKWQMRSVTAAEPKARADIEDNFRKTIGQALGGIAVLIAAGIAYDGTQQTLLANREQSERSDRAAHDQLISQLVAKGFEQMGQQGDDKLMLRLGGIYALEAVMNDERAQQYRESTLNAMCAFVRNNTQNYTGDNPPPTDIQAVLTVIGRHTTGTPDLSNTHIPKADLSGANLIMANLIGANLSGAKLGIAVNFVHADESGGFDFTTSGRTQLTSANLTNANLANTDMTNVNLSNANMTNVSLANADMTGVDLHYANLTRADLRGVHGLTQPQLDTACGREALLPPGLTLRKPCLH